MQVKLNANEVVVKAGNSNFLDNNEDNIQGKLILTNQRLCFTRLNQQVFDLVIEPAHIKEVMYFKTGFLSKKGLNVITKDGKNNKFKIKEREKWIEMINKMY